VGGRGQVAERLGSSRGKEGLPWNAESERRAKMVFWLLLLVGEIKKGVPSLW